MTGEIDTTEAPAAPAAEPAASGREATEAAYEAVAAEEGPETTASPQVSAPNAAATAEEQIAQAEFQRARDEQGRFTRQAQTQAPKPGQAGQTQAPMAGAPTPTEPPRQELKAPGGWSPMAREKWSSLPPEVQSEVHRLDRERAIAYQRLVPTARSGLAFQEMVRPYEGLMRAQGAEPMAAVAGVLQSYATLTMGPMEQRAAQLVRIYKHSGVPLEMLDAALAGELPQNQGGFDPEQFKQQLFQEWTQHQQVQRAQGMVDYEASQLDGWRQKLEFMDTVSPGGHRVAEDMADLMELAARRGQALSHEDAYARALQLPQHQGILAVLQQRFAKEDRARKQAEANRAKAAGSSVMGQPTSAPGGKPNGQWKDPRDATVAAWEHHAAE